MSVVPGQEIKRFLGIVDVHLIKQLRVVDDEVPSAIDTFVEEAIEITKARVASAGGNFLIGMRIDINTVEYS